MRAEELKELIDQNPLEDIYVVVNVIKTAGEEPEVYHLRVRRATLPYPFHGIKLFAGPIEL